MGLEPRTFWTAVTNSPWFIQPHTHTHTFPYKSLGWSQITDLVQIMFYQSVSHFAILPPSLTVYLSPSLSPPSSSSSPLHLCLIEQTAGLSAAVCLPFLALTQKFSL